MPGRRPRPGHLHPITLMRERIEDIFVSLGYAVEMIARFETDFYNFDALIFRGTSGPRSAGHLLHH